MRAAPESWSKYTTVQDEEQNQDTTTKLGLLRFLNNYKVGKLILVEGETYTIAMDEIYCVV